MKSLLLTLFAGFVLVGAVALSQTASKSSADLPTANGLKIESESRNPWTHLRLNNNSDDFQFVVVSDRTGGHRERVFSKAVEQINLLQPEFVLSVGDLIEGYTTDRDRIFEQWKEFQTFTSRLQMPFFYVPGNHDVTNKDMEKIWEEKFGRRYYQFVYKNVLFLVLNSDDPPASGALSEAQVEWAKKVLDENKEVRWTVVSLHKPIWTGDLEKNRFGQVEKALAGRNYTVFCGHEHRYVKFNRNGMNYYQLATTGGDSRLRGVSYGEFDHITWVTMKKTGPVLANLVLDGILPENLTLPETQEPVNEYNRLPPHPTTGFVYLDNAPLAGATMSFYMKDPAGRKAPKFAGDALSEGDGSFRASSSKAFDGLPVGDYAVTAAFDGRYGGAKSDLIPLAYRAAANTPLVATIKAGKNALTIELRSSIDPPVEPKIEPKGEKK